MSNQPWHADAEATALAFTAWLGFDEIGQVTSRDVRAAEAWVGVGYPVPSGDTATAAVELPSRSSRKACTHSRPRESRAKSAREYPVLSSGVSSTRTAGSGAQVSAPGW